MSTGQIKQFTDFSNSGSSDTGTNDLSSIQPFNNGEDVEQTTMRRPAENLRLRSEVLRGLFDDTLYLRDADRALLLAGPGTVTWPGSTTAAQTGIPTLSDNLYLVPFLTPGAAQAAPVPPVGSAYGSLELQNSGSTAYILVSSLRRSYAGGDKINVTVVSGGAAGTCTAAFLETSTDQQRSIVLTCNAPTLNTVIAALNALFPATSPDNTQLVNATLGPGALGTDTLLVPQAKQYMAGNYDGEGHTITPTALAAFFTANPTSALAEGDSLCIQYAQMIDDAPPSVSGRRQSIPENSNTAVSAASFFNSRVNPEKLANAIPVCKVINNTLVFINGRSFDADAAPHGFVDAPATTTALGLVELASAPGSASAPKVPVRDTNGTVNNTAAVGNNPGFWGVGAGTGYGVQASGGAGGGGGVSGQGVGTSSGVAGYGGDTGGPGVFGQGMAGNAEGVQGTGDAAGAGVTGHGGDASGSGVSGVGGASTNGGTGGAGVVGSGTGAGAGGAFTGGITDGPGVTAISSGNGPAVQGFNTAQGPGITMRGAQNNLGALQRAEFFVPGPGALGRATVDNLGFRSGWVLEKQYHPAEMLNGGVWAKGGTANATQTGGGQEGMLGVWPGGAAQAACTAARTNGNYSFIKGPPFYNTRSGAADPLALYAKTVWVVETVFQYVGTFANTSNFIGWVKDESSIDVVAYSFAGLQCDAGGSIYLITGNGDSSTTSQTPILGSGAPINAAPALNTPYRCRFEIHQSGSPYGACIRVFLNGTLVTKTTDLPIDTISTDLHWMLYTSATGTGALSGMEVGPMRFSMNQGVLGDVVAGALSSDV